MKAVGTNPDQCGCGAINPKKSHSTTGKMSFISKYETPLRQHLKRMEFSMSQTNKTSPEAATDIEAVSHQLSALRADMSRLAETVGGIAGRRGSHIA